MPICTLPNLGPVEIELRPPEPLAVNSLLIRGSRHDRHDPHDQPELYRMILCAVFPIDRKTMPRKVSLRGRRGFGSLQYLGHDQRALGAADILGPL